MLSLKEPIDVSYLGLINESTFEDIALAVFRFQYEFNELYRAYVDALRVAPESVTELASIPFLPIPFFKTHAVRTGNWQNEQLLFESSGTTGITPSRHLVRDASLYEASLIEGFEERYGSAKDWTFLALLPSYLERQTSSLVHMARVLMDRSHSRDNGFFLKDFDQLAQTISRCESMEQPVLLLGVTFALLDFAERFPMHLRHTIVMETGGMKGRREEWTRSQVHEYLQKQFKLQTVHSEYGMTELLSQAYSHSHGLFLPSSTMKVLIRDVQDPLDTARTGTGALNIIDLANLHSCAFIATEDLGRVHHDGTFEVLGRLDHSALRGCSLMSA
jgi:phenylacetate-coenzyme A ligase PaaK-like adenylate-forming protein